MSETSWIGQKAEPVSIEGQMAELQKTMADHQLASELFRHLGLQVLSFVHALLPLKMSERWLVGERGR